MLVEDGKAATLPSSFYVNCHDGYYEPRTAIGQIGPLHYIVIVVDGRREGYSTGASIPQLQQLFLDEGAEFAFNLDGGGSTTLYFRGRGHQHALRRQGALRERYHHVYQLRSHLL